MNQLQGNSQAHIAIETTIKNILYAAKTITRALKPKVACRQLHIFLMTICIPEFSEAVG